MLMNNGDTVQQQTSKIVVDDDISTISTGVLLVSDVHNNMERTNYESEHEKANSISSSTSNTGINSNDNTDHHNDTIDIIEDELDHWMDHISNDFRFLARTIRSTAGGVVQLIQTSAKTIVNEMNSIDTDYENDDMNENDDDLDKNVEDDIDDDDEDDDDHDDKVVNEEGTSNDHFACLEYLVNTINYPFNMIKLSSSTDKPMELLPLPWEIWDPIQSTYVKNDELYNKLLQISCNESNLIQPYCYDNKKQADHILFKNSNDIDNNSKVDLITDDVIEIFKNSQMQELIRRLLQSDTKLQNVHMTMMKQIADTTTTTVAKTNTHATVFWMNYFYTCNILRNQCTSKSNIDDIPSHVVDSTMKTSSNVQELQNYDTMIDSSISRDTSISINDDNSSIQPCSRDDTINDPTNHCNSKVDDNDYHDDDSFICLSNNSMVDDKTNTDINTTTIYNKNTIPMAPHSLGMSSVGSMVFVDEDDILGIQNLRLTSKPGPTSKTETATSSFLRFFG